VQRDLRVERVRRAARDEHLTVGDRNADVVARPRGAGSDGGDRRDAGTGGRAVVLPGGVVVALERGGLEVVADACQHHAGRAAAGGRLSGEVTAGKLQPGPDARLSPISVKLATVGLEKPEQFVRSNPFSLLSASMPLSPNWMLGGMLSGA